MDLCHSVGQGHRRKLGALRRKMLTYSLQSSIPQVNDLQLLAGLQKPFAYLCQGAGQCNRRKIGKPRGKRPFNSLQGSIPQVNNLQLLAST